jgi:hypothetical protein
MSSILILQKSRVLIFCFFAGLKTMQYQSVLWKECQPQFDRPVLTASTVKNTSLLTYTTNLYQSKQCYIGSQCKCWYDLFSSMFGLAKACKNKFVTYINCNHLVRNHKMKLVKEDCKRKLCVCMKFLVMSRVGRASSSLGSQCGVSENCSWKLISTFIDKDKYTQLMQRNPVGKH